MIFKLKVKSVKQKTKVKSVKLFAFSRSFSFFIVSFSLFAFSLKIAFAQIPTTPPTNLESIICPSELAEDECQEYKRQQIALERIESTVAEAGEDKTALVGDEVFFSAGESSIPSILDEESQVEYWWNFGDETEALRGKEASHIFRDAGNYTATITIKTPEGAATDKVMINVVTKALLLIDGDRLDPLGNVNVRSFARRHNFLVYTVPVIKEGHNFSIENSLTTALLERLSDLKRSELIIGWTRDSVEVNALARLGTEVETKGLFDGKSIVIVSERSGLISRRVQPLYDVLRPKNVLVVEPSLIEKVIEGTATDNLIATIQKEGSGFVLLGIHSRRNFGTVTFYNFLSHFINSLINKGVAINTILLILMIPVVATFITFVRQVVGIKAFGIYIPTILTLTFVAIGIYAGIIIIVVIVVVGTLVRMGLKKLRLLYLPRMALVITTVAISMLLMFYVSAGVLYLSLISVSVFPILILIILVEQFIKVQMEEGGRSALILTIETIVLSVISFYGVNSNIVRTVLLSYPEVILITFIINLILGKWVGLRLWEYYRFREVIRTLYAEKDE